MQNRTLSWFLGLSIRVQLLLLLLLVMVPSMAIIVDSVLSKRSEQITASRTGLWDLADYIADHHQSIESSVQQTGSTIAKRLGVKNQSRSQLQRSLADVVRINPSCSGIIVADHSGAVIASYPQAARLQSIAHRKSFINARKSHLFSSGEYSPEYVSAESFFSYSYPLISASGDFNGVIEIEINKSIFRNILKDTHFAPRSNFSVIDRNGIILYSHLYPDIVGRPDHKGKFASMLQGKRRGDFLTFKGNDGIERLSCFRELHMEHEETPYLYMRVSRPADMLVDQTNRELIWYSLTLGGISLAAFLLVSIIGTRSIANRVRCMETAASRLAEGRLDTRISCIFGGGELGRLAEAINQMAIKLENRELQHLNMLEELRFKESKFGTLFLLSQMADQPEQLIKDFCLEEGVRTTGSTIGYIYFVNEDETVLTLHSWSRGVMAACQVDDIKTVYNASETGLWGEALRQRKPVITNAYEADNNAIKGLPDGHVPIIRHMNIPLIIEDRIVLLAGVGNKESGYTDNDVRMLTLIMDSMWRLLDKKLSLEERLKNERFLSTLINANLESTYLLKTDGTIIIANEVFAKRLDVSLPEVIGKKVYDLFTPDVASFRKQQFESAVHSRQPVTFEDKRGGIDFLHSVNPVIDDQGAVSHIAVHSMDITTLKEFDTALIATNLKLQALNQKIEITREEERRSIARELHDQMGQALTGLSLDLAWLSGQIDTTAKHNVTNHILDMHITLETLIAMVQNITAKLSPPLLDNLGLAPAIGYYVADFERKSGVTCHLLLDEGVDDYLSADDSISVFRILQESLTNVARHAAAAEVAISLCQTSQTVVLEVADNGKGTSEDDINSPTAFGIMGMQERAHKSGGKLFVLKNPAGGTIVRLEIPTRMGTDDHESINC